MKRINLNTAINLDGLLYRGHVEETRVYLREVMATAIEHDRLLEQSRLVLAEALEFVRRHSEDWYTSGQELIRKCENLLKEINQ